MGTKQQTSYQYNPAAEGQYNMLQPLAGSALASEISNPYNNMFFNTQLGMGQQQLAAQNSSGMNAITQRANAMGMGGNQSLLNFQMAQQQRQGQSNQAGLFNNLLLQAGNMRQQAIGGAMNYRPQQTGMTQQTSGMGTWLPQVAGAGIGMAGMGMMGMGNSGGSSAFQQGQFGGGFSQLPQGMSPQASPLGMLDQSQSYLYQ